MDGDPGLEDLLFVPGGVLLDSDGAVITTWICLDGNLAIFQSKNHLMEFVNEKRIRPSLSSQATDKRCIDSDQSSTFDTS